MSRLGRLKRERDRIRQQPENPDQQELLKRLDRLIERLEGHEAAVLAVLEDELKVAKKQAGDDARRADLAALVTSFAALLGYSVNIPANATEDELLRVIGLLHGLAVQQSMQCLGYSPPLSLAAELPLWLVPFPDTPSVSAWRNNQSTPRTNNSL